VLRAALPAGLPRRSNVLWASGYADPFRRLYRSGVLVAHDSLMSVSTAMNDEVIDLVLDRFAKVS
jgi:hypothetical protein